MLEEVILGDFVVIFMQTFNGGPVIIVDGVTEFLALKCDKVRNADIAFMNAKHVCYQLVIVFSSCHSYASGVDESIS